MSTESQIYELQKAVDTLKHTVFMLTEQNRGMNDVISEQEEKLVLIEELLEIDE